MNSRKTAPVFVVGSARSGTTLLYHMILSAGDFAVFRAETHAYDVLAPRFANLRSEKWRRRLLHEWLRTRHFELSGLQPAELSERVIRDCRNIGDFLNVFMGMMATAQGVNRWSDCTPAHLVHLAQLKREIPNALVVHIIRDGRDVALSAAGRGWVRPLPGDNTLPVLLAALAWRWNLLVGRKQARALPREYLEVGFEDIVRNPEQALEPVARFIDHPLDYARILEAGIGSVTQPNTSFKEEGHQRFDPLGRFRTKLSPVELAQMELLIGDLLQDLGYGRVAT